MGKLGLVLVALLPLAVAGCARDWSNPSAVLTRYLEAVYRDDLEEAYEHLCDDDRVFRALDDYVELESSEDSVIVRELARRTEFEIVSLKTRGDRARASVRIRQPDMSQALGIAMQRGLSGEASFDAAADAALDASLPTVTADKSFTLVREADGWRVRVNWQHESEIYSYLTAAQSLENAGLPAEAVEVYRRALALDDALLEVERRIVQLEARLAAPEEGGAETDDSGWETEWEAEDEELQSESAAINSEFEAAAQRGEAPTPALGFRGAEHALQRAAHNRELLRQLAREDIERLGGSADLVDSAAQVPFDEGP